MAFWVCHREGTRTHTRSSLSSCLLSASPALIEIGGKSDTQPHSCSGASGLQIVMKLTVKIFCVGWEAVTQGTW